MKRALTFNKKYFGLAVLIFIIEVIIALFVRDRFIRPYIGDVLVVILIYCFVKSFIDLPVIATALCVLLFSFTIEFLQYMHIIELLGLGGSSLARTVIGSSFAWIDLLAYVVGIVITIMAEKYLFRKNGKLHISK